MQKLVRRRMVQVHIKMHAVTTPINLRHIPKPKNVTTGRIAEPKSTCI
jgi:hypothetical protein